LGLIGTILKSARDEFIDLTINVLAPKFDIKSRYTGSPGIVGIPLKDDDCLVVQVGEDLTKSVFVGTFQNQDIEPGELLLYSRDDNGNVKTKIHLKKDGSFDITVPGDYVINTTGKFTINADGDIELLSNVILGSVSATEAQVKGTTLKSYLDSLKTYIDSHTHPASTGTTSVPTTLSPTVAAIESTKHKLDS
jgi:hypothetical protein